MLNVWCQIITYMVQMLNMTIILHDDKTISLRNHNLYLKSLLFSFFTPPPHTYTPPQLAAVSPPPIGGVVG
jgi:hypothetical protein